MKIVTAFRKTSIWTGTQPYGIYHNGNHKPTERLTSSWVEFISKMCYSNDTRTRKKKCSTHTVNQ